MNVLMLVGSNRPDSYNALLADAVTAALPPTTTVERFGHLHALPFYTDDPEADATGAVAVLRDAVTRADALVVVTPEYNASVPAVLKNAIDWASRPRGTASLEGKPVAILAATTSRGGAASARRHLVEILARAGAAPLEATVGIAEAGTAFVDRELVDPDQRAAVEDLVNEVLGQRLAA